MFIYKWLASLTYYFTLTKAALGKYLPAALALLLTTPLFAQNRFLENGKGILRGPDTGIFPDTPLRSKVDLSGAWQYTLDGVAWHPVLVPSAYDFTGKVTFQREFELGSDILERYVFSLVAYGINYQTDISINGTFVGRHVGGYVSFVLPIDENILQVGSENVITIAVDNVLTARTTIPLRHRVGGWRNYGGIIRDLYLLATPKLFISETNVKTELSHDYKTAKLRVQSIIENRGYTGDKPIGVKGEFIGYVVELYDKLSGTLASRSTPVAFTLEENKTTALNADLLVSTPNLWSPTTPDFYILKCFIVYVAGKEITPLDEYDLNIGLRDVKFKGASMVFNGTAINVKGVVWREDHPVFGTAMTHEAMERDIAQIKGLGANCVRFLHPPHPYLLNLCDRYGLLVMEEIPFVGVPPEIMRSEQYQELVTNYLQEMVARDRNHVSVFAWGLGDEFDTGWAGHHVCEIITAMRSLVASIDNRPTYYATATHGDTCLNQFPLLAINTRTVEPKAFHQVLTGWKEFFPSKPLVVVHYGKDVQPGNRNGYSDPLSMESQARYAMQHLDVVNELKLAGSIWWSFSDWRGDRPSLSTYSGDPYVHTMGLASYDRQKRVAYDVVRAVFNGEKVAALPLGNYSSGEPMVYVISGLVVLIAFAFIYNSNRRFRENVHRGLTRTYNFFADVRDQRILTYGHSLFLALVIAVTWATVLSSILTHYRDNLVFDTLLSQLMPDVLKEWLVRLVWEPVRFILIISGILIVFFIFLSLFVQACSFIFRTRVNLYHSISVAVWSMLPYIILIPVAMILYRVLETPLYILPSFSLIAVLMVWTMYRLLKGVSVIFDVYPLKVYAVGVLIIVGSVALLYGYLDYTQSASLYLRHIIGISGSGSSSSQTSM